MVKRKIAQELTKKRECQSSILTSMFSEEELNLTTKDLKNRKAVGLDDFFDRAD